MAPTVGREVGKREREREREKITLDYGENLNWKFIKELLRTRGLKKGADVAVGE
jgi:hypothetical protein